MKRGEKDMQPDTGKSDRELDRENLDDNLYLLLPGTVKNFGFHDKKWVLGEDRKGLVKALASLGPPRLTHTRGYHREERQLSYHPAPRRTWNWQTLTAESVAEHAKRPLYKVTYGDIGTGPDAVEKYLESMFYVASILSTIEYYSGCVLLLDESDMFLEERTKFDLQRNALVSGLLHVLEYYNGILILTSNRVSIFNEAFKLRVLLALHYPALDMDGRENIWNNFTQGLNQEYQEEEEDHGTANDQFQAQSQGKGKGKEVKRHKADTKDLTRKLHIFAGKEVNGMNSRNII
ncbi:P-loop containing nucleoside triphosphate hydrolase protein [Zalerion maritima]|uniref:P-loop containing nucleoside triphosphate hydrolase protein n=1 Tax=Zalerion maritima TaxID=339359 RepID=A0AAD5WQ44_9PEZI|nr:P-loop containing nucleoside triphosphate hydrolase protein [Zalerion maritima]